MKTCRANMNQSVHECLPVGGGPAHSYVHALQDKLLKPTKIGLDHYIRHRQEGRVLRIHVWTRRRNSSGNSFFFGPLHTALSRGAGPAHSRVERAQSKWRKTLKLNVFADSRVARDARICWSQWATGPGDEPIYIYIYIHIDLYVYIYTYLYVYVPLHMVIYMNIFMPYVRPRPVR